jgi:hypothetical protein
MQFAHTFEKVLSGEKTMTRRLVVQELDALYEGAVIRCSEPPRVRWEVGNTYAVQPGRGKPAVARIRITDIRREDVRNISDEDVRAEGFEWRSVFLETWCNMHDKAAITDSRMFWLENIHRRPAERYDAWVLTFEVVK